MKRFAVAIGVTVVLAAGLLGFLLFGAQQQVPPPVAGSGPAGSQSAGSMAPPPAPPVQETPPAAESAPSDTPAQATAEPTAEAEPQRPVIVVKPREAAPQISVEVPAAQVPQSDGVDDPDAAQSPSFDVVRVERSGETVIAGRAAPDSEVNVATRDGESLGRARADSSGSWAIVPQAPLSPGSHEIGIEAKGAQGETRLSEEVVVVVVPDAAKASESAKTPESPAPDTQVLAVLTPRQGSGATKVLTQEPEDGIAQGDLVLDSVDYDESGRVIVGGRASPGTRVLIYMDNRLVGDTVAGADGRWSHRPEQPVAEGLHSLRVDQVDRSGAVLARVETPFSREAVRVPEDDEEFVIVQPGNSLWRIARRSYGEGLRYTVIYQANKDQIRDPDLIYPGQVFELPETN